MSKNLVDNLPVSVEFNQCHNLFISCLLDKKKRIFFEGRSIPCLDKTNWEERNHTLVLEFKKKDERAETQKPFVCVMLKYF